MAENQAKLTAQDLKSDQQIRWCAGCGNHAILNAVQKALPELGIKKEDFVFISGIGCSSRFPYYMNTYGIHSIHGRAAAISSGTKVTNPNLSVWMMTGDGDALAIGGNHFIHTIRRNMGLNIIIFNNEIYGLTKGQYSPTSKKGARTYTSPFGTVETPFHPGELVIGSQGKFFARSVDTNVKLITEIVIEAGKHDGACVVEILQNCVIYNDKTHAEITDKEHKDDRQLILKQGEPMIFGKNRDKGIILDGIKLKVVNIGKNGVREEDILVHRANENNPGIHMMLANMRYPNYPVALGVIRNVQAPTYERSVAEQIKKVQAKSDIKTMDDLFNSGKTFEIK
jgi:2-oxoglutarate ferredoxin oxidoreductase subunit beta